MTTYRVTYWTNGDRRMTRTVEAESREAAEEKLRQDENYPLAQVEHTEEVEEA